MFSGNEKKTPLSPSLVLSPQRWGTSRGRDLNTSRSPSCRWPFDPLAFPIRKEPGNLSFHLKRAAFHESPLPCLALGKTNGDPSHVWRGAYRSSTKGERGCFHKSTDCLKVCRTCPQTGEQNRRWAESRSASLQDHNDSGSQGFLVPNLSMPQEKLGHTKLDEREGDKDCHLLIP